MAPSPTSDRCHADAPLDRGGAGPTVEVLLFGPLRVSAGRDRLVVSLPDPPTVTELWHRAQAELPELGEPPESVRPAVNESFASWETVLSGGDRVAFLPPMSGG